MRCLLPALLCVTMGCATFASLGRVIEKAAYPTAGAVGGAALGGPMGAAGGAAAGHLVGRAVTAEQGSQAAREALAVQQIFIAPTIGDFLVARWVFLPNWLLLVLIGVALHRIPWLPAWLWARIKRGIDGPPSEDRHLR